MALFFLLIGVGFMGYSLVWSQIRFWAVVVITTLVSVVPKVGGRLLLWIWGGFSVGGGTLKVFFLVHFLLPFLVLGIILFHLLFLHVRGRRAGSGYKGNLGKIPFLPYYGSKDLVSLCWLGGLLVFFFLVPYSLAEPELFQEANALTSPVHIVPEWYFCAFYGILRRIPNKSVGVLAMIFAVLELAFLSLSRGLSAHNRPGGLGVLLS